MPGSVGELGEDGLVRSVLSRYASADGVLVGPGDDAAVLEVTGRLVVSTDTLVEGRDFRRDWSSGHDVGVKTAAQNFADVAAMGARPLAIVVSLAAPAELAADWVTALADGLQEESRRAGAAVVGGDISEAMEIVVTGTALGVLEAASPVLRSGARPGDVVALAGRTGPSAAGLAALLAFESQAGEPPPGVDLELVRAHLAPRPHYEAGASAARGGASALIDTSDGLLRDAARIAEASDVVLDLDPQALTPEPDLVEAAAALGTPQAAVSWVLAGGEDHALLACFPAGRALPEGFRPIGRVLPRGDAAAVVLVGGRPWAGPTGYRHFG